MRYITVGTKNQIVIPKRVRKKVPGLQAGSKVSVYSLDKNSFVITLASDNVIDEMYGSMEDVFKGIDPVKEINKMRDEW